MLPELVAATMQKLRERDPRAAQAALRAMIETVAISLPAHNRQKFLEELLGFLQSNCGKLLNFLEKDVGVVRIAEGGCGG